MKKMHYFWSLLGIMMFSVLSISLASCGGGDDPTPAPTPTNIVDPTPTSTGSIKVNGAESTDLTFPGEFGTGKSGIDYKLSVAVTSTVQWTMSKNADWISVSPSNGNGTLEMIIYPTQENMSAQERNATITLSGSGVSATIKISQGAGLDANLDVTPTNIITLADGFAFDYSFGSKVKYYYVSKYLPSALDRKTDEEIIAEMSSNSNNRDTPSDGYVTSWQNQSPLTEYIICTVGYSEDGKHGALKKTSITTKKGTNQALATISDVEYNDTYWYWNTTVNGFVTKYYMWFISNTSLYDTTDATVAWFFDKAMKNNPNQFSPIAQGDTWQKERNGGNIFHVATWALDVDGNFSGVIGRFAGSISNASQRAMKQNYVEIPNESVRIKTRK